jgi:hypothetical protein
MEQSGVAFRLVRHLVPQQRPSLCRQAASAIRFPGLAKRDERASQDVIEPRKDRWIRRRAAGVEGVRIGHLRLLLRPARSLPAAGYPLLCQRKDTGHGER